MSYGVRFEGPALNQLNGLPADAFDALLRRVVATWWIRPGTLLSFRQATIPLTG